MRTTPIYDRLQYQADPHRHVLCWQDDAGTWWWDNGQPCDIASVWHK